MLESKDDNLTVKNKFSEKWVDSRDVHPVHKEIARHLEDNSTMQHCLYYISESSKLMCGIAWLRKISRIKIIEVYVNMSNKN